MDVLKGFSEDVLQMFAIGVAITIGLLPFLAVLLLFIHKASQKDIVTTKTCYITQWKLEKSSNGVRVRVPVKQVCVKGEQE